MPLALVTGASVGIGRALALECARDGCDVALVARSEPQLTQLAAEVRQLGRKAFVLPQDLADPAGVMALYQEALHQGLAVDTLINNAGFGLLGRFWELPEDGQARMLDLNVTALTRLTRLFLPSMIAARRGFILNIASTAAFQPGPLMAVYYASKAYVLSFSEALHNEAREFGVSVTALCPGPTESEFAQRAGITSSKLFQGGRVMTAEAVARIGYRAMKLRKPLVIAGRANAALAFMTRFAPIQMAAGIARKITQASDQ